MKKASKKAILGKILEILERIEKIERILDATSNDKGMLEAIDIHEASRLVRLSVATIYSKVSRNEIPVNKVGKKLYFYRSELDNWIRSGRIRTGHEICREAE